MYSGRQIMKNRPRQLKITVGRTGNKTSLTLTNNNQARLDHESNIASSSSVYNISPRQISENDVNKLLRDFSIDEIDRIWDNVMNSIKLTQPKGEAINHIKISYKHNLDILDIHRQVLLYFHHQYYEVPKIKLKMDYWKICLTGNSINPNKSRIWNDKLKNAQDQVNLISKGDIVREYLSDILPYIDLYNRFTKMTAGLSNPKDQEEIHHLVIQLYITKTQKYFRLEASRQIISKDTCPSCDKEWDEDFIEFHGHCSCGYVPRLLNLRTTKIIKGSSDSEYEDLANFILAISRQEATQTITLPETLFDDLDRFFLAHKLPTGQQVRSLALNINGSRGQSNIKMLDHALKETGYSTLYVEGKLIASTYWGWKIYNLSDMKDEAIEMYKTSQPFYNRRKGLRESSMNVYFRLYKTIQLIQWKRIIDNIIIEYKFRMRDFRVIETPSILCDLEDIWRGMCYDISLKQTGWICLNSEK